MRVSTFTVAEAGSVLNSHLVLVVVLWWASKTLVSLEQQNTHYGALKNDIIIGLSGDIEDYLSTGDAQNLVDAKQRIETIQNQYLPSLSAQLQRQLNTRLQVLLDGIDGDYRALGKLGNETALLDNVLRQMAVLGNPLINYAQQAPQDKRGSASRYIELAGDYYQGVLDLSLATQALYQGYSADKQVAVEQTVKQLNALAAEIENTENLGVMSEVDEGDELFFGAEPEDLAGDIKAEIRSWPKTLSARFAKYH